MDQYPFLENVPEQVARAAWLYYVGGYRQEQTAFHWLTGRLPDHEGGYGLAGWNLHDGAVLVRNGQTAAQLDPATGEAAWTRPLAPLIDGQLDTRDRGFTICGDGQKLVYVHTTDSDEIPYQARRAEFLCYLAVGDLAAGGTRRLTLKRFNVATFHVSTDGGSIFLRGFRRQDGKVLRDGGVEIKQRLYRCDLLTGQLTPLVEGGEQPSVSRD